MSRRARRVPMILGLLLIGSCAGLSPRSGSDLPPLLWPPPPQEPRIQWLDSLAGEDLALRGAGFWSRVGAFLAGEDTLPIARPHGIYAWGDQLAITNPGAGQVHLVDRERRTQEILRGPEDRPLLSPVGVTGDGEDILFVSDSAAKQVYRYSLSEGRFIPFGRVEWRRPTGLAYDRRSGLLYVADTLTHSVVAVDQRGYERFRFGGQGEIPGRFYYPTHLFLDSRRNIWVTDALNYRVQQFSREGRYIRAFGEAGDTSGDFARPVGIAVDSEGHVYVCDALFDTVQIFDWDGRLLLWFGRRGGERGEFWMPSGLFIDDQDRIYVADTYNRRIQIFRYMEILDRP